MTAMAEAIVVFPTLGEVEPWYQCPGRYRPDPTADRPWGLVYIPGSGCRFRAPWRDRGWVEDRDRDKAARAARSHSCRSAATGRCSATPAANDGCDLADCVTDARDTGRCPYGCAATIREVKAEPVRPHLAPETPERASRGLWPRLTPQASVSRWSLIRTAPDRQHAGVGLATLLQPTAPSGRPVSGVGAAPLA